MMSLMTEEELATLLSRLEQQELDCQTGSGTVPVSVYCELLACYLATQPPELAQAKFLMQRVPLSVQEAEEGQELARLWRIGRSMWTQNTAEVYSNLAGPWSEPVQRIMDKVSNLKLVGDAYSSIRIPQLSLMLGVSEEEAVLVSERQGWGLDREAGVVTPVRDRQDRGQNSNTEDQLEKIIHFVSYLEN